MISAAKISFSISSRVTGLIVERYTALLYTLLFLC